MSPSVHAGEVASRPSRVNCGGPMMSPWDRKTLLDLLGSVYRQHRSPSTRHEHQMPAVGQPHRDTHRNRSGDSDCRVRSE